MKGFYYLVEVTTVLGLIQFGAKVGTTNMWFTLAAILISTTVFNLLYKARRFNELRRKRKVAQKNIPAPMVPENIRRAEENALIRTRHFYNDAIS